METVTTAEIEQEIKTLRDAIGKGKILEIKYGERLKALDEKQAARIAEMTELDTTPEDIAADIEAISADVQDRLAKTRNALPMDLILREGQ